jgi:hypothetical protein
MPIRSFFVNYVTGLAMTIILIAQKENLENDMTQLKYNQILSLLIN